MATITRKIKLIATDETKEKRISTYKYIQKIAEDLTVLSNEVVRKIIFDLYSLEEYKKSNNISRSKAKVIFKEKYGFSPENSAYRVISEYDNINSNIRSALSLQLYKTLEENFYDVLKGKISIPSFKKYNTNIPIILLAHGESKIYSHDGQYRILFPLSRKERTRLGDIELELFFGKDRSNNRVMIERAIAGEYKLCDSKIQIKESEIFLLISLQIPDKVRTVDENLVMGVDIGINRPATVYINGIKYQPQQIAIGQKFQHERIKLSKVKKGIQQSLKYSKGGKGVKRKLSALDRFREKEKNWAQLINHNISREVVNIAKQYSVGTINLEDLSGITSNAKDYFMKSWSFYQLTQYIEYKAKMEGIKIQWVNPKNTSITCPTCKTTNPEYRSDKDKTKFKCTNIECDDYNHEKDADVVGAINISQLSGDEFKPKSKEGRIKISKQKRAQSEQVTK